MRRIVQGAVVVLILAVTTGATPIGGAATSPRHPEPSGYDSYVALGDSYTAGPLIPELRIAGGCFRSTGNYPALLAERLGVGTLHDVSCSGATTKDMTEPQQTPLGTVPPQLDALETGTDLVTLGIGGNDFALFGKLTTVCPSLRSSDPDGAPCREHFGRHGRDQLRADISRTRERIARVVEAIEKRAPDARVVVVGYPRIAPAHGTCPARLPLADGDYRYITRIERALNAALRSAARHHGAAYVDMFRRSRGHDVCSEDPWVNGHRTKDGKAAAYHPFAAEMAVVADTIAARLDLSAK